MGEETKTEADTETEETDAYEAEAEGTDAEETAGEDRDDSPDGDDQTDADETDGEDQADADGKSTGEEDISGVTAPSVGPHTTFEREGPEERLARHEQSDTDAMGLDKRREVIGGSYGPSTGKQAVLYGSVLAIAAVLVIGFILLAGKLDQPPPPQDKAPWATEPEAGQEPPDPIQ